MQKYVGDRNQLKMVMQSSTIDMKKTQMQKYLNSSQSTPPWILANDMVQYLHFIDDTDSDFRLLDQLMQKFKLIDVRQLRNINIGSILMKMLHYFKKDESAQKVFSQTKVMALFFWFQFFTLQPPFII